MPLVPAFLNNRIPPVSPQLILMSAQNHTEQVVNGQNSQQFWCIATMVPNSYPRMAIISPVNQANSSFLASIPPSEVPVQMPIHATILQQEVQQEIPARGEQSQPKKTKFKKKKQTRYMPVTVKILSHSESKSSFEATGYIFPPSIKYFATSKAPAYSECPGDRYQEKLNAKVEVELPKIPSQQPIRNQGYPNQQGFDQEMGYAQNRNSQMHQHNPKVSKRKKRAMQPLRRQGICTRQSLRRLARALRAEKRQIKDDEEANEIPAEVPVLPGGKPTMNNNATDEGPIVKQQNQVKEQFIAQGNFHSAFFPQPETHMINMEFQCDFPYSQYFQMQSYQPYFGNFGALPNNDPLPQP